MINKQRKQKGKNVLNKADRSHNVQATREVLERCRKNMKSPRMMHFIVEFKADQLPTKIIQKIKETYISQFKNFEKERDARLINSNNLKLDDKKIENYKVRKRKPADIEIIYSIESKMIKSFKYDHIHLMFIVDFGNNRFEYREIVSIINRTLNKLPFVVQLESESDFSYIGYHGENECGFLRYRDCKSTIQAQDASKAENGNFINKYGHDLKTEFNDAMIRASYLCKSEQKDLLPDELKRYSFGHTRPSRACNDDKYTKVA